MNAQKSRWWMHTTMFISFRVHNQCRKSVASLRTQRTSLWYKYIDIENGYILENRHWLDPFWLFRMALIKEKYWNHLKKEKANLEYIHWHFIIRNFRETICLSSHLRISSARNVQYEMLYIANTYTHTHIHRIYVWIGLHVCMRAKIVALKII